LTLTVVPSWLGAAGILHHPGISRSNLGNAAVGSSNGDLVSRAGKGTRPSDVLQRHYPRLYGSDKPPQNQDANEMSKDSSTSSDGSPGFAVFDLRQLVPRLFKGTDGMVANAKEAPVSETTHRSALQTGKECPYGSPFSSMPH
jgi:hypothetical protein